MDGRQIVQNIIDIEMASQKACLEGKKSAVVLFDFEAAFPSVDHSYIWRCLKKWGVPSKAISAFQKLYCNNTNYIKLGNIIKYAFDVTAGVRQGCPLSPLLFVLVIEPLLCKLSEIDPNITIRAFADDIAMVIPDMDKHWRKVTEVFDEFANNVKSLV